MICIRIIMEGEKEIIIINNTRFVIQLVTYMSEMNAKLSRVLII